MMPLRLQSPLAALVLLLGCAVDEESPSESQPLPAVAVDHITISTEPDYVLPASASDPALVVFRATYAAALDDGTFVVGNNNSELLFLDSTGVILEVAGGEGQGPGELSSISGVFNTGSGVAVWDSSLRRVSRYTEDGAYLGATPLPPDRQRLIRVQGYLPESGVVISLSDFLSGQWWHDTYGPGAARHYQVLDTVGQIVRDLHGPPEPPPYLLSFMNAEHGRGTLVLPPACAARPSEVVLGGELFSVDALAGRVLAIDPLGAAREVYTARSRGRVSAVMRDSLRAYLGRGAPASARVSWHVPEDSIEAALSRVGEVGAPLPAWTYVIADPTGRIWLKQEGCLMGSAAQVFEIIDPDGRSHGTVELPANLEVRAVYGDRVLVVRRDDLRVEHLEQYRLMP